IPGGSFEGEEVITAAGAGGGPHVKVFSAGPPVQPIGGVFAYDPAFTGGVRVASAPGVITAPGPPGGAHIKCYVAGAPGPVCGFFAFGPDLNVGFYAAFGILDGRPALAVAPDAGGLPGVRVFR
ncbi:MAG: hypothetical protein ACREJP_01025, partial [Candidatus Methylomirabilales bacterium]